MNSSLTKNASPKKTMTNAGDLIASVEAFAAYLKEFSPDTEKDDRLTKISKSFTIDQGNIIFLNIALLILIFC